MNGDKIWKMTVPNQSRLTSNHKAVETDTRLESRYNVIRRITRVKQNTIPTGEALGSRTTTGKVR